MTTNKRISTSRCQSQKSMIFAVSSVLFLAHYSQYTQSFPLVPSLQAPHLQPTLPLKALSQRQTFIFDGGELESFLIHSNDGDSTPSPRNSPNGVGCVTLVTGTTEDDPSRRIVGVEKLSDDDGSSDGYISLGNGIQVYRHTVATIPGKVSDTDAMSTAAASMVGIHCAIPKVDGVGGSDDDMFYSGKAVVLGGNDYACFLADGLATLGIDVSLVSTGGAKVKNKQVKVMQPSVQSGDEEVGFSNAIGQFDSLIDTIANERKGMILTDDPSSIGTGGSSVLQLLKSKNLCHKYISTLPKSQQIVKDEGVIFGPGKANSHVKSLESLSPKKCTTLIPSSGFGSNTLQTLLENNVLFTSKNNKSTVARGWAMKDFWEETSWPRDSSGTGVRFGLPVVEEEDLDAAFRREQLLLQRRRSTSVGNIEQVRRERTEVLKTDQQNPFVTQIVGVDGLAENIISKRQSCVVFVAMRSCKTCKGINPMFTKMARDHGSELMFAKADATGSTGKALGRQLGVAAVPSFVLFRNGIRYGAVSTSKLPSDRLDQAICDLEEGRDFDPSLEEDDD